MPDDPSISGFSLKFGPDRQLPDLQVLEVALHCHELIKSGRARSLSEVAEQLGLGKDTLYRRVNRFEQALGQLGHKGVKPGDSNSNTVFEKIRYLLDCYSSIVEMEPSLLRIRLGASQTLNGSVVGEVLARFNDWCDVERPRGEEIPKKIKVDPTPALPQALRAMGERGELDLLLCSCEQNYVEGQYDVVKRIDLPLQIIFPHGHPAFEGMRLLKEETERNSTKYDFLKDMMVVKLEPLEDRKPIPDYPDWIVNKARVVKQVPTYPDIHNLVKAGGDVVGFSFGELLTSDEQSKIETLPLVDRFGESPYKVPVCLIRPSRSILWRTPEETRAIDQLAKLFAEALDRIDEGEIPRDLLDKVWEADQKTQRKSDHSDDRGFTRDIYHLRTVPPGNGPASMSWAWARGQLKISINKSGYIKGEHWVPPVKPGDGAGKTYRIFGRVIINEAYKRECQLVWQGKADEEVYVANFVCSIDDLIHGDLVGAWFGRASMDPTRFRQSAGYLVALRKGKYARNDVTGGLLSQLVDDHGMEFGHLELKKLPSLSIFESLKQESLGELP